MVTVEEIRKKVESIVAIVKDLKTIEDARNLHHCGYSEDEIGVEIDGTYYALKDAMFFYEFSNWNETKIQGVFVSDNSEDSVISNLYYDLNEGKATFGVFDKTVDPEYNFLEDVTLEDLEEAYSSIDVKVKGK